VPARIHVSQGVDRALAAEGQLADIAPTLLELMDFPKPKEMNGVSLLRGN
jgi:2,3-bisphosphoglycerate-independent phosphoglycerate mutase